MMLFFKKFFNMDHVERIQWGLEFSRHEFARDNIAHCRVFFCSGHERELARDEAREMFDFLDSQSQALTSSPGQIKAELIAWANYHRGLALSPKALEHFMAILTRLDQAQASEGQPIDQAGGNEL